MTVIIIGTDIKHTQIFMMCPEFTPTASVYNLVDGCRSVQYFVTKQSTGNWLTNSMRQRNSTHLVELKVTDHIHSQMGPICTLPPYVFKVYFHVVPHLYLSLPKGLLQSCFTAKFCMKISVLYDITPCSRLKVNRRFEANCRLHLQGRRISQARKCPAFFGGVGLYPH
jgi:hypothetical protein